MATVVIVVVVVCRFILRPGVMMHVGMGMGYDDLPYEMLYDGLGMDRVHIQMAQQRCPTKDTGEAPWLQRWSSRRRRYLARRSIWLLSPLAPLHPGVELVFKMGCVIVSPR